MKTLVLLAAILLIAPPAIADTVPAQTEQPAAPSDPDITLKASEFNAILQKVLADAAAAPALAKMNAQIKPLAAKEH